jgi:hypothetical protein
MVREEEGRTVVLAGIKGWWCDGDTDNLVAGKNTKRRHGRVGDSNAMVFFLWNALVG